MATGQRLDRFDDWLVDDSDVAALTLRQRLVSVEGEDAVIFPPTYTFKDTERQRRYKEGESVPGCYENNKGVYGYNIDALDEKTHVCQIDSVGSQANRMEPIFKEEPFSKLVPRVIVKSGDKEVDLLDAGHRAADAIVRFSGLKDDLEEAFRAIKEGDAEPLAKIAPTTLVFGAWDSRATQVKLTRIVRSVIRAYGVAPLHRSAQYIPPVDYVAEGLIEEPENKQQQDAISELGLGHAPAAWTHGGVQILSGGEIRRDATLNLVALRSLGAGSEEKTRALRRYILGLSLISITAHQKCTLREGCQLVPDADRPAEWRIARHDGRREPYTISPSEAVAYASQAAEAFEVGEDRDQHPFDSSAAREALGQSKQERKQNRRGTRKAKQTEAESEE